MPVDTVVLEVTDCQVLDDDAVGSDVDTVRPLALAVEDDGVAVAPPEGHSGRVDADCLGVGTRRDEHEVPFGCGVDPCLYR